jgi:hypothetical protein
MDQFDDILALLKAVPQPPEGIPPGIQLGEIRAFEEELGFAFPPPFRKWLEITNGPCVGPGGLCGIRTLRDIQDIAKVFESHPQWKNRRWVPVAGDGCGDFYLMATTEEFGAGYPVFFVDIHENENVPTYVAASGLWPFLRFFLGRELASTGWPFRKEFVLARDPAIIACQGLPFPWQA